jgi:hypothetical protein
VSPSRAAALALFLGLCAGPAAASGVVIDCTVNLSLRGAAPNLLTVRISRTANGPLQSEINGALSNPDVRVTESRIRNDVNLKADPYGAEARSFNDGERSLAHLESIRELVRIPFQPAAVRRTVIYDLLGKTNKFGGSVLIEGYGADGKLLGRVLRSVMAGTCA